MKRFWIMAILLGRAIAFAQTPADSQDKHPSWKSCDAPRTWLGLKLAKPDDAVTVHVPSLPPGIGFTVTAVEKDGPAAAADLKEFDLLWKLGDQMLVNEGQLATLLRLSKPGDEVELSIFRAGKPMAVTLKLGEAPVENKPFPGDLVDAAIMPGECGGPMRVINVSDKLASYSNEEGRAEVWREGAIYKVKITNPNEELIYQGDIPADGALEQIPDDWRRRVYALRRGLRHALEGRMLPQRQPRPRVVPPPAAKG
jgi:hypothetical protein